MWMYNGNIIDENDLENIIYDELDDYDIKEEITNDYGSFEIGGDYYRAGDIIYELGEDAFMNYKNDLIDHIAGEMRLTHIGDYGIRWVEYKPTATEYTTNDDGCCILVKDSNGILPDIWVDVWVKNGDISSDFNKFVFFDFNRNDRIEWAIQHDETGGYVLECAEEYAIEQGLITQNDDGTWTFNGEVE